MAALNGLRSCAVGRPPPIDVEARSVLTVVAPRPGKCLTVGATPASIQPLIAADTAPAVRCASRENARDSITEPGTDGTSATGASATLMPRARSALPAARESGRGSCPAGGLAGGAQETIRIWPPC